MKKKIGCLEKMLLVVGSIIIVIVLLMGLLLLGLYIDDCQANSEKAVRNRINSTTGIEIPTGADMVYVYYAPAWQESFIQYSVFSFKNEPTDWLENNNFLKEENAEFEEAFKKDEPSWLKEKVYDVSSEYYPNFENSYYWLNIKDLTLSYLMVYFIYETHEQLLMIYNPH